MPFLSPDFWRDLISLAYLSIAAIIILLVVVGLARAKPKDKRTWLLVPLVAAVVFAPGGWLKYKKWQADQEWAQKQAAQIAHFEMRCKSAGEKIYQTVKGVEGIFIMKPRIVPDVSHYQDQFGLWDPYGTDPFEAEYLKAYIKDDDFEGFRRNGVEIQPIKGFRFVEALAKVDGKGAVSSKYIRLSYKRDEKGQVILSDERRKIPALDELAVHSLQSRYGMTWSDISTKEDREKWIAGGLLQVIDLVSGAVVAERRGFMREPGMGHKQYDRMTWSFANRYSCPQHVIEFNKDTLFLSKVFPK